MRTLVVVASKSYRDWRASAGWGTRAGVGRPLPRAIVLPLTSKLTGRAAARALLGRPPRRIGRAEAERAIRDAWPNELNRHTSLDAALPDLLAEVAGAWDVK